MVARFDSPPAGPASRQPGVPGPGGGISKASKAFRPARGSSGLKENAVLTSVVCGGPALFHEEVGRSTQRVIGILHESWSRILGRIHQILWCMVGVKIPMDRMERQIAVPAVTLAAALRRRTAITIRTVHHLPARSHAGLAHRASVRHHRTRMRSE